MTVGFADASKPLFNLFVARVVSRVIFQTYSSECLINLLETCMSRHTQNLIVVLFGVRVIFFKELFLFCIYSIQLEEFLKGV